ncbi:transglutaminase domain-containing protein [Paenibacillus lutrae]|uniref:Transglutaminase domain-containing protein n=1 Tax=Paenibacillus lutrae TaxID=2078573 RepID=A0A7X3FLE4_9BACL|nr:transglutaminase domain-containing protein [Paenibacillus lutrae]MVP01752.1 transglutaminase domain-containing protein [Paenibacillus lutrae]
MSDSIFSWESMNIISVILILVVVGSAIQGIVRGTSGSAKHLLRMICETFVTVATIYLAWQASKLLSVPLQNWLKSLSIQIPAAEMPVWKQTYYTAVTAIRDFELFRFGVLFLLTYLVIRQILYWFVDPILLRWAHSRWDREDKPSVASAATGGLIGSVTGAWRAMLVVAVLFVYVTLFPQTKPASYIGASNLYQKGAREVIQPFTGDFLQSQLPVFTRAVEQEFNQILQRKYEVVDANIPADISAAAKEVTKNGGTDEEKAELLYKWVGSRVAYDYGKVDLYEQQRIWKEQTPEDTFASRTGVCIDYSRLYAVMARSIGLDVKVVTGLGSDGRGGYGPHAWNEVYLTEKKQWVPLDATWVSSGSNWFNPPDFDKTHIRDV